MALKLPPNLSPLLREVVQNRCPPLLRILDSLEYMHLTDVERDDLRQAVADEFMETGLQENDEPNKRGLLLDELIARLGHL